MGKECENKCSECVYIDLEHIPVTTENHFSISNIFSSKEKQNFPGQIRLLLTINFQEQWEDLKSGRVKFGVCGGELRLNLTNGEIPFEKRKLVGTLEAVLDVTRVRETSTKAQTALKTSVASTGIPLFGETKPSIEGNQTHETTEKLSDTFQTKVFQVSSKGEPKKPVWQFKVRDGDIILSGLLLNQELATMLISAQSWQLEATFEVSLNDVQITDGEAPWLVNLIPEQRKALDIGIAKLLLKHKLKPYVSKVVLNHV